MNIIKNRCSLGVSGAFRNKAEEPKWIVLFGKETGVPADPFQVQLVPQHIPTSSDCCGARTKRLLFPKSRKFQSSQPLPKPPALPARKGSG